MMDIMRLTKVAAFLVIQHVILVMALVKKIAFINVQNKEKQYFMLMNHAYCLKSVKSHHSKFLIMVLMIYAHIHVKTISTICSMTRLNNSSVLTLALKIKFIL